MPESLPDSLWSVHLQSFCRVHVYTCILWFSQGILLLYRVHVYMYILWFCRVFIFLPGTRLNVYFAVLQGTSLRVYCSFAGHVYRSIVLQGIKIRFAGLHVYFVILRGHTIVYVYILSCCRVHIYIVFCLFAGYMFTGVPSFCRAHLHILSFCWAPDYPCIPSFCRARLHV